ncbi:testis-specific gene 13 protein isoform X2 [Pantherophis guttatus]|uniref:Testis-specific gene 13 protein isoform X2 n=1 Tax=Pantherophis guttatus TaxID=94885 RepID=A0A6P9B2R9_PANGU|nr:testis-specific gene 13 protein isoform X2 [Pantherophis guttatus]
MSFYLTHEVHFSPHPNLTQYFIPPTDAEFQERLEHHRREIAVMLRSSEFNQDKTALIVTNNPFPLLVSGQHLATPFQYFPKDLSRRVRGLGPFTRQPFPQSFRNQTPRCLPPVGVSSKVPPGMEIKKLKIPTQLRFTSKKDFKGDARFSKNYAEKRLQRLYPQLHLHSRLDDLKNQPLPRIQGWSAAKIQWEPLTLSCLTEMKPTFIVPGEDGFRHGKAPLWIVNNSVVLNSS